MPSEPAIQQSFVGLPHVVTAVVALAVGIVIGRLRARSRSRLERHAVSAYSQEGEDLLLDKIFSGQTKGFYVDVGAHHPSRFSNTRRLHERGWRGINIDPSPAAKTAFDAARPVDINLQLAIDETPGERTWFEIDEPAVSTLSRELAAERAHDGRWTQQRESLVPARPLRDVLHEHVPKGVHIDLLNIDVEGWEMPVLRSNDWDLFPPRVVMIESRAEAWPDALTSSEYQFLRERGYELIAKTFRTLVFRAI
jgi:FkbM family methyltransferase